MKRLNISGPVGEEAPLRSATLFESTAHLATCPESKPLPLFIRDELRAPLPSLIASFSINTFCSRNDISRSTYFALRRKGNAPAEVRIGRLVRITLLAEQAWLHTFCSEEGK